MDMMIFFLLIFVQNVRGHLTHELFSSSTGSFDFNLNISYHIQQQSNELAL